ncbi:Hypp4224 [Branchiostoma lanceolatum]|uniref:Hypp4224 protein n=1 Tax=Branchiostoma lanceolatum TaxID=7740 RepID=A0A8K0A7J0_BRALA|nr:Hypp4224 [Branchiostoma lanceolatum]
MTTICLPRVNSGQSTSNVPRESMASFTLLELTAKNDTMTGKQSLQQPLLMDEGGAPYFSDEKFCMGTNGYNNNHTSVVPMAQEFYMETHDYYNNPTSMLPITWESYIEAPYYYINPTTMAQKYMGTTYYNNNHTTSMAQGSYMETGCHNNHTTMVPMAQKYMGTTYYNNNNNHTTSMVQGSYMETSCHNNHTTMVPMAQGFYTENPYYNNTSTTVVPITQEFYTENLYYGNTSTTVVPLTQEWVSRLQTNMNDGYGPSMIMEKFLTSLPECESETPAYQDGSVQECNPEVGENEMSSASKSCNKSDQMTRSEITKPEVAPPGDIRQDCSNDSVKCPACPSQYNNNTGDVQRGLQEADLHNHLDIDDWIILLGSEAGSLYYSDDEEETLEEMTGYRVRPDGDSMEERQAFPTSSVQDGLVHKLSDYTTTEIKLLDHLSDRSSEDLEEIQLLDSIDSELDDQSDGTEEKFQLLDAVEIPGPCVCQNSVPEHKVVTTNRLSRYDLYHGPTHHARSPSCPLIGARGNSRERSMYSEDTADHKVNDVAVRTTKGKTVKPAAHKRHCNRSHVASLVNPPLPGCPCWLLLMGLASVLLATIDVKQKLGKLLGKSCQGQPNYRQPHTQQKTSYVSKYPRWKTCLLCLRLPWQLTSYHSN